MSASGTLKNLSRKILDLLLPLGDCAICGSRCRSGIPGICLACFRKRKRAGDPQCSRCGRAMPETATAGTCGTCLRRPPSYRCHSSVYLYDGPVRQMVLMYKTGGRYPLSRLMGGSVARNVGRKWEGAAFDLVTFVPSPALRRISRGFSPAGLIAAACSRRLGIPLEELLRLNRRILPQKGLTLAEREENVKGAFSCRGRVREGSAILLVDDVFTTGATIESASRALAAEGAVVFAATFAMKERRPPGFSGEGDA